MQILEPCHSSLAYQPPNPWTMGILGLLAEIYSMPNLKMNLKFDIEVWTCNLSSTQIYQIHLHLCSHDLYRFKLFMYQVLVFQFQVLFKNLGVDMKDITPTSLLKDKKREIEGNPDFSNKDIGASQPQMVPEVKSGIIAPLNHVDLPLEVASPPNTGGPTHLLSQVCTGLVFFILC